MINIDNLRAEVDVLLSFWGSDDLPRHVENYAWQLWMDFKGIEDAQKLD